jgi:predicted PurR-regulated permease PerM
MNLTKQKFLSICLTIILVYIIILLSNITLPIVFSYFFKLLHILRPFIFAFFIAFLLHTLVDKVEERGINRALAVLFVFLIFFILMAYLISMFIPIIIRQIRDLIEQLPALYLQLQNMLDNIWNNRDFIPEHLKFSMKDVEEFAQERLMNFNLTRARIHTITESFTILILTPIITYYFLYDYNNIKKRLRRFLKRHNLRYLSKFIHDLDNGIGSYFRGLILIMNMLTLISTILFMFTDLKYPLLFGFLVGYTNVIPIIGPYIGGIPAVLIALTDSFNTAIIVTIIIVVLQIVESNIITPYIQSKSIDAHPLLILLAFVLFGTWFGVIGMILAIPLLYLIMLICKYVRLHIRLKRYQKVFNTK